MIFLNFSVKLKAFNHLNYMVFILVLSVINLHQLYAQEIIWHKMFDSDGEDYAKDVATDSEGNIVVTGCTIHGNTEGSLIVKYNTAGDTLWTKQLLADNFNNTVAVHIDDCDNIYVIGMVGVLNEDDYIRVIKYGPDGTVKAIVAISDTLGAWARSAAIDSEKNIIIAGVIQDNWHDYITIKYDSSGNLIWYRQYDGDWEDELQDVTIDNSDNIIVTGYSDSDINWDWCTIKYSPDGDTLWIRRYDVAITDWAYGVTTDREGNVIVVGDAHIQYPGSGGSTAMVVKYSSEGDTLWSKIFQDTLQYAELGAFYDVTTDSACNIYLAGDFGTWDTLSRYDGNFYVAKCKPSGDTLWSVQHNPGWRDEICGITLDIENNIIITGTQQRQQHEFDYMTLKISNSITNIRRNEKIGFYSVDFSLEQNYPNPFNPTTVIKYRTTDYYFVTLAVYNMLGQRVRTLIEKKQRAGEHSVIFDAFDFTSGLYFYRLTIGNKSLTRKLLLIR